MTAVDLAALLDGIPYLAPHRVSATIADDGAVIVRMPFRPAVTNYVGIVHAGALFTLAETAAGVAANRLVEDLGGFVLLRGAYSRFTRRADSETTATARIAADRAGLARSEFSRNGQADLAVIASVTAADGFVVFEGTFDYALRPRKA